MRLVFITFLRLIRRRAQIRRFFLNTVHFEFYQTLHNSPRLVKSSPLPKKEKPKQWVVCCSFPGETGVHCVVKWKEKPVKQSKKMVWMSRSPSIQFPDHPGEKKTCYYVSWAGKRENSCAFCFLRIWIWEEEAESDCGQKTNSFFFFLVFAVNLIVAPALSLSLSLWDVSFQLVCFPQSFHVVSFFLRLPAPFSLPANAPLPVAISCAPTALWGDMRSL